MEKTYILKTSDYSFAPYSDGGFSGKILLATPKKSALPKLLIKSHNPCSACNEFMYSRLAELLDIPSPKVYIMDVATKDAKLFGSPYVAGIEYMDGMHRFSLEEMRSSPVWKQEYAWQYALAAMFDQDDRVQLTMRADGHITGFDFTESFWLTDLGNTAFQLSDNQLTDLLIPRLHAMVDHGMSYLSAGGSVVRSHHGLPDDAPIPDDYLEPMRKLLTVTEDQVLELTDALHEVYPSSIPVYFEEYIKLLKKKLAIFLRSLDKA